MSKLYFRYGAMNCGKSSALMQVAHNYNENDKEVFVIKSSIDTKADDYLESRIGLKRKVDLLIDPNNSFMPYFETWAKNISCVLVDEAQFLSPKQVEELHYFAEIYEIPVICYGLLTDFQTHSFPGSQRLFELADEKEELITICKCGKKAKFNARFVNGVFQTKGETVIIDGSDETVEYKPMCGKCYVKNNNKFHNLV